MKTERIDFIDAYCDRWCERCPFTMRCAGFDHHVAVAMCDGDLDQAFELALSRPDPALNGAAPPEWLQQLLDDQPTENELEEIGRQLDARDGRVKQHLLSKRASGYSVAAYRWFSEHTDRLQSGNDAVVSEALEVARWDASLFGAKLDRAMTGREGVRDGGEVDDHPVQTDWNGSAKVALISLERSEAAWRAIADATGDAGARALSELVAQVRRIAQREFPRALEFVRPGFDEPWR